MTRKFIMTSKAYTGSVVFGFDDGGKLVSYENTSSMNSDQSRWLFSRFPFSLEDIQSLKAVIKGKLELVPINLTFDAFWNAYAKKVNRKRCEVLWKKLNEADRIECLMSLPAYDAYLRRSGRKKLDPENYLKRESYKNNWNQITS